MEWQANAIAPKILIPAKTGRAKLSELLYTLSRELSIVILRLLNFILNFRS